MINKSLLFIKKHLFFLNILQKQGFTMTELLTTASVVGVLSVVGIKSYQSQTNKARSAEAQHSLTFIYTSETSFKESWNTYHENLIALGAVPSGTYHYDVGFGKSVTISKTDGDLGDYPLPDSLDVRECTNFHEICEGDCTTKTKAAVGKAYDAYAANVNCSVTGGEYLNAYAGDSDVDISKADADADSFLALAIGPLTNLDVWSIDQEKTIGHPKDGTQ